MIWSYTIQLMADQSFSVMFDNDLMKNRTDVQEKIAREMSRLDMALGPFVSYADFGKKFFEYFYSKTTIRVNRTSAFLVARWGSMAPTRPTFLPISFFKSICAMAPLGIA